MASLQAFDGDTLEAALARVTEACGPGARIAQAEKVRTGGIAGFFARERYEVMVELDDAAVDPTAAGGGSAVTGGPSGTAAPSPVAPPRSLLDLVEEASAQEREAAAPTPAPFGASPRPAPSTEGPTFQEVLRGIASQAGLLDLPAPVAGPAPGSAVPQAVVAPPAPAPARPAWPAPVDDDASFHEGAAAAAVFRSLGIPDRLLDSAGGPASLGQRLLAVLERVPQAPPVLARRGDVVLVVGDATVVGDAATVAARELGQVAEDVVVGGQHVHGFQTLSDPSTAAARASMWRRCGAPLVVALDAPPGPHGAEWVVEMRSALDPVAVWGAVPAARKPEDVAAWASAIGGVDALAVGGCDATATPAAVLAAGIPVAALEGRRASAAAWTALLMERLSV